MKLKWSLLTVLMLMLMQSAFSQSSKKIDSLNYELEVMKLRYLIDSLKNAKTVVTPVPVQVSEEEYAIRLDALKRDFTNLNNEVAEMKMNLDLCHKKFRIGLLVEIGGAALMTLGALAIGSSTNTSSSTVNSTEAFGVLGIYAGIGGMITGTIIMANSHKYIGYAGHRKVYFKPAAPNLYTR